MCTLDQINKIHDELVNKDSLPEFLKALKAIGVHGSDTFVSDGHTEYFGTDGHVIVSPAEHDTFIIASTADNEQLLKYLDLHNRGTIGYLDESKGLADSGVYKCTFDTANLTVTYYYTAGANLLTENVA